MVNTARLAFAFLLLALGLLLLGCPGKDGKETPPAPPSPPAANVASEDLTDALELDISDIDSGSELDLTVPE